MKKKNRGKRVKQAKRRGARRRVRNQTPKSLFSNASHSCCVAFYYEPGEDPDWVVRATCAIVDLSTDDLVALLDAWAEEWDMEDFVAASFDLAMEFGCYMTVMSKAVPLEHYPTGGCGKFLVRTIQSWDIARLQAAV